MNAINWFLTVWYLFVVIVGLLVILHSRGMKLPVSGSRYKRLLNAYENLYNNYHVLLKKHEAALWSMRTEKSQPTFSDDEIKKLVFLCHPDKHNNSATSQELTKKLLELRNK